MKTWEIQVYKRQKLVSNGINYTSYYEDTTESEYIDADYFFIDDCGNLAFHSVEVYPEYAQSLHGRLKTSRENCIAAYHANQWLSVREYIAPENTNDVQRTGNIYT